MLPVTCDQGPSPAPAGGWQWDGQLGTASGHACPKGTETRVDRTYNSPQRPGFRGVVPPSLRVCQQRKRMAPSSQTAQGASCDLERENDLDSCSAADW